MNRGRGLTVNVASLWKVCGGGKCEDIARQFPGRCPDILAEIPPDKRRQCHRLTGGHPADNSPDIHWRYRGKPPDIHRRYRGKPPEIRRTQNPCFDKE
jgi:hypothetical protein